MSAKIKVYIAAALLFVIGLGLTLYKNVVLGFPLLPGDQQPVWTIEAEVNFSAVGDPVLVSLALPLDPPNINILEQDFASPGYGISEKNAEFSRRGLWSKRSARGDQSVFYRLQVHEKHGKRLETQIPPVKSALEVEFDEPLQTAATTLIEKVRAKSASPHTFTAQLLLELNAEAPDQNVRLLRRQLSNGEEFAILVVKLLSREGIAARVVRGLHLEDGRRRQQLTHAIEVYDDADWQFFNLETGATGLPDRFMVWQRGGRSLLEVSGGRNSAVYFSIVENYRASKDVALQDKQNVEAALIDFSIYSLPLAEQNAFKSILLVPIGALVVVVLRLLVGLKTSGTFMPILIALAFIQTSLVAGVLIFLLVVGTGLIIRSYLSRLNLLLVARISAVIIVVILIMASMSVLSIKLGIDKALTVTFFPMIILAWTIERMSILWEEDGPKEVLLQGGGSLLVATIAYLCMTNRTVEHLTFNFPELLLILLGVILLLGQYTGYRLSELRRFHPMVEQANTRQNADDTKTTP
ncbi:MAG: UUP1 family membrane protein [Pseudomonadales bacterium]